MTTLPTLDGLERAGLTELLGGIGSAAPGPLFLVDHLGRTHPLNGLARELKEEDDVAQAFVSPVSLGNDRVGRVVGYVPQGDGGLEDSQEASLVSALVALAADVVSRSWVARDRPAPVEAPGLLLPRDAMIDEACARLAQLLEESAIAEVVVAAARQATGARSVVLLVPSETGRHLVPLAGSGIDLRRVRRITVGHGVLGWAATQLEPTEVPSAWRLPAAMPRHGRSRCALESWLGLPAVALPVTSGTQLLALLCVEGMTGQPGQDVTGPAVRRLERLVDKAAANLAGARMLRQVRRQERVARELEIARQIQQSLLPAGRVDFPGLQVVGQCRAAAQVGGDWFGFRSTGQDELIATVFDVAGHGIGAAFCMTLVRSALQGEIAHGGGPGQVLGRANGLVWEDVATSGLFATALLARFDRARGLVSVSSAGHSRPILWSARRRAFVEVTDGGLPLGLLGDSGYPEADVEFGEDDVFVAYTDGIVEATAASGEKFGRHRLVAAIHRLRRRPAAVILRSLWAEVERFLDGAPLSDDATLTVARGARGFGPRRRREAGPRRRSSVAAVAPGWEPLPAPAGVAND